MSTEEKSQAEKMALQPVMPLMAPAHARNTPPLPATRGRLDSESSNNLPLVLNALRRWAPVAVPIGLAMAVAAMAVVFFTFQPKYKAAATLLIRQREPRLVIRDGSEQLNDKFVETQREILRSHKVLAEALASREGGVQINSIPELAEEKDKIRFLEKRLEVGPVGKSELFSVAFTLSNPKHAQAMVDAVVRSYMKLIETYEGDRQELVLAALKTARQDREQEVKESRAAYRDAAIAATGKDPFLNGADKESRPQDPLSGLQLQLVTKEVERRVLEAELKALEREIAERPVEVSEAAVEHALAASPDIRYREEMVLNTVMQLERAQRTVKDPKNDSTCRRLEREVAEQKADLERLRQPLEARIRADLLAAKKAERQDELQKMRKKLDGSKVAEEELRASLKQGIVQRQEGKAETVDVEFKRSAYEQAEQVFKMITLRITELNTERKAPARVLVFDDAQVPPAPVEEYPLRNMALAGMVCFFLPFGVAVGWETLARRVVNGKALARETNLAVVGEIARLPSRSRLGAGVTSRRVRQHLRLFEESIDNLRTALMLSAGLQEMRVIAVTSAANDEGKTSVAAQLALSLARASGQATLLIDGDLRQPDIHNIFEITQSPGLAEVLAGDCQLADAVVTSEGDGVHLLPAGELHGSPHQFLGNGKFTALMERVRSTYRYVVIDTPPILAAGEALVLARASDTVLLCAMRDVSRAHQVRTAAERLTRAGCHTAGTVLNGVSAFQYQYQYGAYYEA